MTVCLVYCVSWCCGSMSCVLCEFVFWQHALCIVGVCAAAAYLVYCGSLCCGIMSCVLCESDALRLTLYSTTNTSAAGLKGTVYDSHNTQDMLPQHQLTQHTTHAATTPTHTTHKTCCHNTNSHNTQHMLPQHQLTQYTRHATTAPTRTIHKTCCRSTNSHNTQDMLPQHKLKVTQ